MLSLLSIFIELFFARASIFQLHARGLGQQCPCESVHTMSLKIWHGYTHEQRVSTGSIILLAITVLAYAQLDH